MSERKLATSVLVGAAAVAALGFVALSHAVARGSTKRWDQRVKRAVQAARARVGSEALTTVARSTAPLGKWWGYVPAAFGTALKLRRDGRTAAAFAIAGTSVAAAVLPLALDRLSPRRQPPPERHDPGKQSFPSGHALQTSAMAIAAGYVMRREQLASPRWLAPLGSLSLATGLGRLILDRHWATDLVGGYCAGIALGTSSAALYELAR